MNELNKVDRILEAWLEFIRIKTHSEAQVPEKDTVIEGISLCQNNVLIDETVFLKRKKTYDLNKRTACGQAVSAAPWLLSFPQIYTVEKGRTSFCPLFSLDISSILSGEYQIEGWDISQLPMAEAGENLMTFSQVEEEKLDKLVTKEGLHRFLKTTFEIPFDSFEDWMQQVPSLNYEIIREPYLFSSRGGGYSKNLQADLKSIRHCDKKHWIQAAHPAYQYLFGKISTAANLDTYYLGAFPTNPPTDSQLVVLKQLKNEVMTAVQGPPGSGKTTLILHAIAQQIVSRAVRTIEGKPDVSNLTLVTSSNNRAVDNVIEKLRDFACPSPYLPVPFLYLEGGAKTKKINKAGGAAEQIEKAKEYLSTHCYSDEVSETCVSEIRQITSEIAARAAECERLKQQRQQDMRKRQQLATEISALQQALAGARQALSELQKREGQISTYNQLPKAAYEYIQTQFRRAQMQLPGKLPRWIRWLCWFIGKTEPQIIAKMVTDRCQQAIRETQGTPFPIAVPNDRAQLYDQKQQVDKVIAAIQELQTVEIDLQQQAAQMEQSRTAISQKQEKLRTVKQRLLSKADDFYQIFHIAYEDQHRALFYWSQQFLLQRALQRKEAVLKSLTAYGKLIGASGADIDKNIDRMATALNEHMSTLSLVFPVVTSSLLSVRNMLPWTDTCIDLTIIDEAGMILLHDSFPALVKTRKALVVGDPLQIEPIVSISPQTLRGYQQDYFLDKGLTQDDYYLYSPSELDTATTYHRAANANVDGELKNEIKLKEHFRCQQSIIDYCSDIASYDLVCKTKPSGSLLGTEKGQKDGKNIVAYHVEGKILNQVNVDEVDAVCDIFTYLVEDRGYSVEDIGVVAPFSAHAKAIRDRLRRRYRNIEEDAIGTVHKFQGSEKLVMIFSTRVCQRQESLQWINRKPNMLNVAVSRAKELFILVGNLAYLQGGRFTRRLIEHTNKYGVVLEYKTEAEVSPQYGAVSSESVIQNCEHLDAFANVLRDVKSELYLAVPKIGGPSALQFVQDARSVLERGVRVTVLYGTPDLLPQEQKLKALFDRYENARLIYVEGMGTNQRLLLCDDQFAIAGSWNWLSHMYAAACARQAITAGVQIRKETSFRLNSADAIKQIKEDLRMMMP